MNGLSQVDYSDYMPTPQQATGVTTEAMVSRQAQEVQAAMVIAKKFPRDVYAAFDRIKKACERRLLAENAVYEYPRGGTKVSGPSIRLAEALAQNWGNIDYGIMELEQKAGESSVMAYAWDLETNTRQTKIFTVKHERKARGAITKLDDPRDIYEMVANQGARRVRACILGVIPGDIVDAAVDMCQKTLISGHKEPLEDRLRSAFSLFKKEFGITKEMIQEYIGSNVDAFTEQDFLKIGRIYTSLRDGMAKKEDYFNVKATGATKSKAEEEFKKQKEQADKPADSKEKAGDPANADTGTEQGELLL
ncbi:MULTISPECIES: hypothetical protein [Bacillus amyloliquefaciens group]|uniref:hypothetical protein n=1 Tax=Bacillus amyloliquefaciens group TaxID=1938374 RepID=UPI00024168D0|nr:MULTISPECIES: hypothetical protein [Bacillus amyloliquefaciens group]AGF28249.1 hypothetical protein KSO_013800 [Bacillus amyloliquefaciens IT-45]AMP32261.1 hypothetical protein AS588_09540 [Bacillus amyloliquefaciens]ERK82691.1 hypothetical protein N786_12800 [Bacillus amyloliquefaciens UASWS BA1]MBH5314691.1 hypothetical protein [Bacillus velezensis]MDQ1915332.1 hypothetical protein [Bacillus velezensis]